MLVLASILLLGSLALTLFWVMQYHGGFAWREDPGKQFNLHPVLMVAGFITFSGFCEYFLNALLLNPFTVMKEEF